MTGVGCECLVVLVEMGEGGGPERSLMPPCTKEPPSPALQQCEFLSILLPNPSFNVQCNVNDIPMLLNCITALIGYTPTIFRIYFNHIQG